MLINAQQYAKLLPYPPVPQDFATIEAHVVRRIEAALGRPLVRGTFYEVVTTASDRIAYPKGTPVVSCAQGTVLNAYQVLLPVQERALTLEYVGGYTEFEAADPHACPYDLALAVACGISTLTGGQQAHHDNVASMAVAGDYTVSFRTDVAVGADGVALPKHLLELSDLGGRCAQLAAKYRRVPTC